jgi:hypothetical protein
VERAARPFFNSLWAVDTPAVALEWDARFVRLPETVRQTWVSKHGAFTVLFDHDQCVVSMTGERGVRIVPPWQRWWKVIWTE